jgi:8-oxo-dGTP diphosphatase
MKHIQVVAAIIYNNKQEILCVQRGSHKFDYISKKYEFPGGKVEKGETKPEALKREIQEELHLNVIVEDNLINIEHTYPDFKISMSCYTCSCHNKNLVLTEHIDFKWLEVNALKELDWAAADIPAVQKLMKDNNARV